MDQVSPDLFYDISRQTKKLSLSWLYASSQTLCAPKKCRFRRAEHYYSIEIIQLSRLRLQFSFAQDHAWNTSAMEDALYIFTRFCTQGSLDVCHFLFSRKLIGLWKNRSSSYKLVSRCAFRSAANSGQVHILHFLRDLGLGVTDIREDSYTALFQVCGLGLSQVLQFFKNIGLTTDDIRFAKSYALFAAVINNHLHILQCLRLEWDLTLDDLHAHDRLIFRKARQLGHVAVRQFLKEWEQELLAKNNLLSTLGGK